MNYERPELMDRLAGEYVLGTLRGPALRRFRKLMARSGAMRAAVLTWEQRLAPLATAVLPVPPPPLTWQGIEERLGWQAPKPQSVFWQWLKPALVFGVGAVLGVGVVLMQPQQFLSLDTLAQREQALPQSYVGLLSDKQGRPTVLASATRHGDRMTLKILRKIDVPEGKVLQLWALPQDKDGKPLPAMALGTLPAEGKGGFAMTGSAEKLLSNVPRLGVTLQDAPAQPGEQPGEFVLTGHCVKLW